jgi:hypothetical protein
MEPIRSNPLPDQLADDEYYKQVFGPAARYSEHQRGERVTYRIPGEEGEYVGVILWVVEASEIVERLHGVRYIVIRDGAGDSFPDIVFPSYVLSPGA